MNRNSTAQWLTIRLEGNRAVWLQLVESSWIVAAGFDGRDLYLLTARDPDTVYVYHDAKEACRALVPGESIGAWYNSQVKGVLESSRLPVLEIQA